MLTALEKLPADRYASASDFAAVLTPTDAGGAATRSRRHAAASTRGASRLTIALAVACVVATVAAIAG